MTSARVPPSVAVVEYAGAQRAAVLGLIDLLEAASRVHGQGRRQGMTRTTREALTVIRVPGSACSAPRRPYSALVLPPSLREGEPPRATRALARWIAARHQEGTVACSVCVGAFLLADTGLLDDRPCTTHWAYGSVLSELHPRLQLDTDRLLIDEGDVVTAGGLMAWVDLGLHLVARFLGPDTMLATARMFLVDPGGREQRFYAPFSPELTHGDRAILTVQRWLQRKVGAGEEVSVDEMAAKARLGRRTFMRRFERVTGMNSSTYLQHLRVAKARTLLDRRDLNQEEVAWAVGYADPGAFRRVFIKIMGLSPAEYRRRFRLPG